MGKKLEGNGTFESSRIIIPEHKEAYLKLMKDRQRRGKPELDDQLIEQALIDSYNTRTAVTVTIFNPFDDEVMTGVITVINTARCEVKLARGEDDFSWIKLEDIISVNL